MSKKFKKTKRQLNEERRVKLETEAKQRKIEKISVVPIIKKPKFQEYVPPPSKVCRDLFPNIPSYNNGIVPKHTDNLPPKYEDDMLIREQQAQQEIQEKKKRVAPLYNKSGYMYLTDGTDPKDIGRKNPL